MTRYFNTEGICKPTEHYMVSLDERLEQMRKLYVDRGKYFVINRGRQFGKTTTLISLAEYLKKDYLVVSMDFQTMSFSSFESEQSFVAAFTEELLDLVEYFPDRIREKLASFQEKQARTSSLQALFKVMKTWCKESEKKIVLIIDEVDTAANNQVFVDFLAQLRACYLKRRRIRTFQSVILAGVYDVRSIRGKIRPDEIYKENSPWNVAADFLVDMSFSSKDIVGMLEQYEMDHHTGMDLAEIANLLYDYTSGYPYLVSRLCKLMDERIARAMGSEDRSNIWTKAGCLSAVKMLLEENNPLFDSLINKLYQFPELKAVISRHLFQGQSIAYDADDPIVRNARMFGFLEVHNSMVQIANRIFEIRLYNRFLSNYEEQNSDINKGSEGKKSVIRSYSMSIRKARTEDLSRIAEIFVFNNRMNFFPIFKDEGFSFGELQVVPLIDNYFRNGEIINNIYVFDDGIIRGFIQMNETEICKLYVDTFFQSKGLGGRLMEYAIKELHGDHLWALEKNTRAIMFYQRHGFSLTGERKYEEGTTEYLVELAHHRKND